MYVQYENIVYQESNGTNLMSEIVLPNKLSQTN
jgi:hypothetical protein